jgi:PIN domain nuclease of toxin-antitoxin system
VERVEVTFLDTHVAVWICINPEMLSDPARSAIEEDDVFVSPMVVLELQYLYEIGRLKQGADIVTTKLESDLGLKVSEDSFARVITSALNENWTRDPFDRIIVGHARCVNARLVTKDELIQKHYTGAVW